MKSIKQKNPDLFIVQIRLTGDKEVTLIVRKGGELSFVTQEDIL